MEVCIEFYNNIIESTLPIIRLTKSRNKMTGTATFIFIRPIIFQYFKKILNPLTKITLIWKQKKIVTNDLKIIFYKGKPFLIKCIFLFKNSKEWFQFLNFMHHYSKKTGLSFTEIY
jgi:photosystem II protein